MKTKRFVRIGSLAICCALGMTALAACTGGDRQAQKDNA